MVFVGGLHILDDLGTPTLTQYIYDFLVERFPSLFYSVCVYTYIYIYIQNTGTVNVIAIHPVCEISGTHPIQKKTIRIPKKSPVVFLGICQLVLQQCCRSSEILVLACDGLFERNSNQAMRLFQQWSIVTMAFHMFSRLPWLIFLRILRIIGSPKTGETYGNLYL